MWGYNLYSRCSEISGVLSVVIVVQGECRLTSVNFQLIVPSKNWDNYSRVSYHK